MDKAQHRSKILKYTLDSIAVVVIVLLLAFILALHFTRPALPRSDQLALQENTLRARVGSILEENLTQETDGLYTVYQKLELTILTAGEYKGTSINLEYNGMGPTVYAARFRPGSTALLMTATDLNGEKYFLVADHIRLAPIGLIVGVFIAVSLCIGRGQGARALIGLLLSGLVIAGFIVPQILAMRDPVLVAMSGTALLLAITLYLIQGWNYAGHSALIGMLFSLLVTGGLSLLWTRLAYLTGFGSEETMFLQASGIGVQMRGLLLAGIIIGAASVLDDVVIAQSVAVFQLRSANQNLTKAQLYHMGMKIGTTHLASMINTLILAYTSTALPLIILFYIYPEPWYLTINRELIAEEIIRAITGSISLMLAVPLTTYIAATIAVLDSSDHYPLSNSIE
ncbi:MAG: YibE/F family protein [Anaerolineae bacterium]|nr:YibE/F family protein [Anaerolineae bacterium]